MTETASARYTEEELAEIEEYASGRGISRSQAIKELSLSGKRLANEESPHLEASDDLETMHELVEEVNQIAAQVEQKTRAQSEKVKRELDSHIDLDDVDDAQIQTFAEEPYKVLPRGENEYYVVVPRFVPFSAGHLHEQEDAWQVFIVNKYVDWIEDIPEPVSEKIDLEKRFEQAIVRGDILELSDEEERDEAWDDLGGQDGGLFQRKGEDKIKIKSGQEFDVIAQLIERGNLPFAPKPIDEDDLRGEPHGVELRPYQQRAWEEFSKTGQVGVYWPPALGKTFFSLYAGERVSGKKLVVVPSSTLESQWKERIQEYTARSREWEVRTYQYLTTRDNMQDYQGDRGPTLTIFDECHTLPANTFSKLATLDTDYRMGLSATPYREDDRTDYIFALTGVPVGIDWRELLEYGDLEYPEVTVYLYRTENQKREDVKRILAKSAGKTLIFCDRIDPGQRLADELGVPFVHGETPTADRMEIFRENNVVVASRVADEGLSLEDLDRVIEYQFHGSSRRQELQRAGRVMHSDGLGQHIVQMTDDELEDHGERLYSLEEKGMDIRLERRD
jgi:DNA excision repair protein ERCC-3